MHTVLSRSLWNKSIPEIAVETLVTPRLPSTPRPSKHLPLFSDGVGQQSGLISLRPQVLFDFPIISPLLDLQL